jgi:hypothetical protein
MRRINAPLLAAAVRVWATEILISGFNYFVLMQHVYEPRWGELAAHQIGMTTRIGYIFALAWLLLRYSAGYSTRDVFEIGGLWLALTLVFEWGGSLLLLHRPVHEIVIGWHITDGYMWPYVLVAYFCAAPAAGLLLHPRPIHGHSPPPSPSRP